MKLSVSDLLRKNVQKLEKEKARVEEELKNLDNSTLAQNADPQLQESEFESRVEDMEIKEGNNSLRENLTNYLAQIKSALHNIQKKKYGICERCGKTIAPERLAADPSAIYCLQCAEIIERINEEA